MSEETANQNLNDYLKELGPGCHFKPGVIHQVTANQIQTFWKNSPSYYEQVSEHLGVYKDFDTDEVVGVEIQIAPPN